MKVDREKLVYVLEGVIPGTEDREIIEQSTCFVFKDGYVYTYNEDVSCKAPLPGKDTQEFHSVAVKARALLNLLRGMSQEVLSIEINEGEMVIIGEGSERAGLRVERDIALPIDNVESPDEWLNMHSDFIEAVALVQECAGTDNTKFKNTCVHLHPQWVEACDGLQLSRYTIKTKIKEAILVRKMNISHIITKKGLPRMTQFCVTKKWIHFTNKDGLVMSIRYHKDDYPDITKHLEVSGKKVAFPKELLQVLQKAKIFSQENANNKLVKITLREAAKLNLVLRSEGPSGWYEKKSRVTYNGPSISFLISPKLIEDIANKYQECEVTDARLIVKDVKWRYVACLGKVEDTPSEDPSPKKVKEGDATPAKKKIKKGKKVKV